MQPNPTPYERQFKWDLRFLDMARLISSWSKDPSTKVGAVIVRPDMTIVSLGYNGFPRLLPDDPEAYADRTVKYQRVVHAETNAILSAERSVQGCTLYTYPLPACVDCTKTAIQAGIRRFVSIIPTPEQYTRWGESFRAAEDMLILARVERVLYSPASLECM